MHDETDHIISPPEMCRAQRGATKDNGDGSVVIVFKTQAIQLPASLRESTEGSSWIVECQNEEVAYSFLGMRQRLVDCDKGMVEIRFLASSAALPAHALFGTKGQNVDVTLRIIANTAPYPYYIDKAERSAVMVRIATNCQDPRFHEFLERECARLAIPVVPGPPPGENPLEFVTAESLATEHLYRILGIHSRREILESNKTAEKAEGLIRRFRDFLRAGR